MKPKTTPKWLNLWNAYEAVESAYENLKYSPHDSGVLAKYSRAVSRYRKAIEENNPRLKSFYE